MTSMWYLQLKIMCLIAYAKPQSIKTNLIPKYSKMFTSSNRWKETEELRKRAIKDAHHVRLLVNRWYCYVTYNVIKLVRCIGRFWDISLSLWYLGISLELACFLKICLSSMVACRVLFSSWDRSREFISSWWDLRPSLGWSHNGVCCLLMLWLELMMLEHALILN